MEIESVQPYRNRLYTAEELYAGLDDGYERTLDARCYAWSRDATTHHDVLATMVGRPRAAPRHPAVRREDLLLVTVTAGIVYLPGAAGTVQELFQAATPGYYSPGGVVPLVLLGREHWTRRLPAWDLLGALAAGRPMAARIHLLDDATDTDGVLAALGDATHPGPPVLTRPRP